MPTIRAFRAPGAAGLRLAATLLLAAVAVLASTSLAGAQGGCRAVADLGRLTSYTTIDRTGLLHASSCRFDGVRYYDKYLFELPGAGEVSVSLRALDFSGRLVFNTGGGEYLAGANAYYARTLLRRTLPAGSYLLLVVSQRDRDAGSYKLTVETGRIEAPPPVNDPDPPPVNEPNPPTGGEQTLQSGSATTGRVVARVHALLAGDSRGAYRIEFGFFTDAVLAGAASRSAAIQNNARLLPQERWLSAALILRRAAAGNRGWLRSSPIRFSSGASAVAGRVIVRWNPASGGPLRLEFGFLPEWTLDEAGGADGSSVAQAAARHASLLPDSRYLTEAGIAAEQRSGVARWLFSSEVRVPPPPQLPQEGTLEQGETTTPTAGEEPVYIPPEEEPDARARIGPPRRFARCGSDTIKVYWFNTADVTRYHLDMPWEAAQRIIPEWGEQLISHLSQANCDEWTLGSPLNEHQACRIIPTARCG